jgi:hypothetical protein
MPEHDLSCLVWRKSTRSQQNGACVEAAYLHAAVVIRDSKDSDGPKLTFDRAHWHAFIRGLKDGSFG